MISEIQISGFQGFGSDQAHIARLAPLTLVFGPNASGKSSLLRAIKLIHQSVDGSTDVPSNRGSKFRFEGEKVSLASFSNCAHMHYVEHQPMEFGISYTLEGPGSSFDAFRELFYEASVDWSIYDPGWVGRVTVEFKPLSEYEKGLKISFRSDGSDGRDLIVEDIEGDFSQLGRLAEHPSFERHRPSAPKLYREDSLEHKEYLWSYEAAMSGLKDQGWWDHLIWKCTDFELRGVMPSIRQRSERGLTGFDPAVHERDFEAMAQQFALRILGMLLQMAHSAAKRASTGLISVAPLRTISERLNFQQVPTNSGQDVEIERTEAYEQKISDWLEELTEGRFSYKRVSFVPQEMSIFGALESPQVVDNQTGTSVSFKDVGVGLSQVLPILEALALRNITGGASKTILVEQPELHLHPKMQASLADLFIEAATSRRVQVVAETHSEAFLLRIQRRLREGKLSPRDVQILYVEPGERRKGPYREFEGLDYVGKGLPTNTIRSLPLRAEDDFEIEFPVSFAGLRLSEYL